MRNLLLPLALVTAAFLPACGSSEQSKSSNGAEAQQATKAKAPGGASGPDTSALDKRIEQAEAKAKAAGATQADKMAAASAYLERANLFYSAGQPTLYKFALRDFRLTLRYDPNNVEARAKRDQIVDIYTNSLHRPVPDLGNEP